VKTSHTLWKTNDIWIRREFDMNEVSDKKQALLINDDIYYGVLVTSVNGYVVKYQLIKTEKQVNSILKVRKNTIAIYCHLTTGGQYIDCRLLAY
jgi:hypothetical protein